MSKAGLLKNNAIRNMFFDLVSKNFESQAQAASDKKQDKEGKPRIKIGKIIHCSFIVTKEKTINRIKYEGYEGDREVTPAEAKNFASMVGLDMEKEFNTTGESGSKCVEIFYSIVVPKKIIAVQYNFENGTEKTINI